VSFFSLLLRVILSLSLVANGASYAQESARMQFEHVAHAAVTETDSEPAADDANVPPCHRHAAKAAAAAAVAAHAHHAAAAIAAASTGKHPLPVGKKAGDDCCKGKACKCACAHASCAATVAIATQVLSNPEVRVPVLVVNHPQPRLPHLIRPPIG